MDIILDASIRAQRQQGIITQDSEFSRAFVPLQTKEMRDGLVDMGRPLWQNYKVANAENELTTPQDRWEGSSGKTFSSLLQRSSWANGS